MTHIASTALTGLVFVTAWTVAWFTFIAPLLRRYAVVAGLAQRIAAAESLPHRIALWCEAKKTLAVAFLMSLLAAAKGALDTGLASVAGVQGADLAPLQDRGLWSAFFGDIATLHIVAALSLLAAFLTLKGKVAAAAITPRG